MERVRQLGYLGLSVSDLGAWQEFATQVLGLEAARPSADGPLYLRLDECHHRFLVYEGGKDDIAFAGWEVDDERALGALGEQLAKAGTKVTAGTADEARERRVAGLLRFEDPSGIGGELYYGLLQTFERPFHSPRPISGFVTGDQGLGHIVLSVDDMEQTLVFYRDVLGMRVSDFIAFEPVPGMTIRVSFMHCNPRHHTLAFAATPLPKRMLHFMLQARSLDDVGSTYFLCRDRGVPLATSLGRHTNDHMVSFYMRSPSTFEIEYGWGARTVDDATWRVQTHSAQSIWGHVRLPPDGRGA